MRPDPRPRTHPTYVAFLVHRISGLLLALFLPLHFWALSRAIAGEDALEGFLRWTDSGTVKAMETILVVLLAAHLAGGLRVLAIEFLDWHEWQKSLAAVAAAATLAVGLAFALAL